VAQPLGEPMGRVNPAMANREVKASPPPAAPPLLPLAPRLMLAFWALLGAVAGINLAQVLWRLAGVSTGAVTVAVPVGAVAGAVGGGLVGLITGPRLLVLIMALLAGWSVGALVGRLAWDETGHLAGALTGALLGALTWGVWLRSRWGNEKNGRA
jgi:hypothetical protein